MHRPFLKIEFIYFDDEPHTKREAWSWLVANSINGKVSCSVRNLANQWKWHRSKVERFLQRVKSESLIETELESGKLVLSICNNMHFRAPTQTTGTLTETAFETISNQGQDSNTRKSQFRDSNEVTAIPVTPGVPVNTETISRQDQDSNVHKSQFRDNNEVTAIPVTPGFSVNTETISSQDQDSSVHKSQFRDSNEVTVIPVTHGFSVNAKTISSQNQDSSLEQEEEKKKRSNKRKEEELLKEKNIPYGDTKKEKFVPVQLVQESDVAAWVKEVLQIPIDLTWELGKFKDHWLTTRNKPPKDGIAAFRNWLRKSFEINKKYGGKIGQFSKESKESTSEQSTSFERFLAGGARALAKLSEH